MEDSYRNSADVIITGFSHRIVAEKKNVNADELKQEVEAVKKTMKVIKCATNEASSGAFEEVTVAELVDDIILTTALYDTLMEASVVPEQRDTLAKDFALNDEKKADMKVETDAYRADSVVTRSPEEIERILEITDALAVILNLQLEPIQP